MTSLNGREKHQLSTEKAASRPKRVRNGTLSLFLCSEKKINGIFKIYYAFFRENESVQRGIPVHLTVDSA